jgi:hypothetical protein
MVPASHFLPLRTASTVLSPILTQPKSPDRGHSATNASTASAIAELKQRGLYTSLQQAMQAALYRVEPKRGQAGHYAADNIAQRYSVQFGAAGIRVQLGAGKHAHQDMRLRLSGVEEDGHPLGVSSARLHATESRMEYDRGDVQEWYTNTPQGLEQGFTIVHKPVSGKQGSLRVRLAVSGGWQERLSQDGQWVDFVGLRGGYGLRYGKLCARDARGRVLGSRLRLSGAELALEVDTRAAAYPVRIDPLIVGASPKLIASDGASDDNFGSSVSLDGNTALVGAPGKANGTGAAYLFVLSNETWTQQAKLTASDAASGDSFGWAVGVSGDTALVAAPNKASGTGTAYVFVLSGGVWSQQAELTASDGGTTAFFGYSVGISGNTALVGAYGYTNNSGAAYVFVNNGGTWSQQQKLTASDGASNDQFGRAVSISGNTALVGARFHANSGAAYVFTSSGGTWTQQAELTASDRGQQDQFGFAVSVGGNTALVGAPGKTSFTGAAYLFTSSGGTWTQQQELTASNAASGDDFGWSVSVSGNTALVGAPDKVTFTGAAYVFSNDGGTWTQQVELTASGGMQFDQFGYSVSISGNTIIAGAPFKTNEAGAVYAYQIGPELDASDGTADADFGGSVSVSGNMALIGASSKAASTGAAYVFVNNGGTWTQQAELAASDGAEDDDFGTSVSISGNTALVGAPGSATATGAAYVFINSSGNWIQQTKLAAGDAAQNDFFGTSVSLSGNTALVGAPLKANDIGAAYIFVQNSGSWTQQAELTASDGTYEDYFGGSVSVSGNTALIGAPGHALNTGAAYVFVGNSGSWTLQAELTASDASRGDGFGGSVSVSGNIALIGAPSHAYTGAAYVFVQNGGVWTQQQELTASNPASGDDFGSSVSVSGNTALIGARSNANSTGAAYVFVGSSGSWTQQAKLTTSDAALGDYFGWSSSISGDIILVGAPYKANGTGAAYTLGQSPVAQNDTYVAYVNTPLTVANAEGVLANDTDPFALPLTALLAVPPASGSLTFNSDGSFVYTPDTDFSGTDTFAYQATDGFDTSDLAWVTIQVITPVPPAICDLDPTEGAAGAASLCLLVNGSDFTTSSVVSVNNTPVATLFVSDAQLLAAIPAAYLSIPTTLSVQVNNPQPNGASNSVSLPVVNFLDSVSTATFVIGGSPATLTIHLNTPAPQGGLTIALSSSQPDVAQPVDPSSNPISQVMFSTGQQTATVMVQTSAVTQQTTAQLKGSVGGTSRCASLLVLPPQQSGVGVIQKPGVGPPLHLPGLPKLEPGTTPTLTLH